MKHDSNAVHAFLGKGFKSAGDLCLFTLQKCIYFSNGASSQYKNYTNFANLCHHMSGFQLAAEWNFFITSHGKSPCDGTRGTVKSFVASTSLWYLKEPIDAPEKMFLWCKNNIKGAWFLFVFHSDVANHVSELKLDQRYESWYTAPGSTSYHMYVTTSISTLEM